MSNDDYLLIGVAYFSLLLALAPIIGPHFGRDIIRQRRADMISRFEYMIGEIQACEFVKYKYLPPGEKQKYKNKDENIDEKYENEPIISFILAAFPLFAIVFSIAFYSFSVVIWHHFHNSVSLEPPTNLSFIQYLTHFTRMDFSWIVLASFCASYINIWYNFLRALRNYEFHSMDCIEASIDMLLSVFISTVFYAAFPLLIQLLPFIKQQSIDPDLRRNISVVVAIAIAYYPDIVRRYIINFSKLQYVKVEKSERFNSLEIIPVEVIDGIDTNIRKRLEDYHIVSVQNLATSNPVMLFVETPFVIYELVDWVAQAQLITAVGLNKTVKLWALGVRTVIDLHVHATVHGNPDMLKMIGDILLEGGSFPKSNETQSAEAAKTIIATMIASPHVARLVQLVGALRRNLEKNGKLLDAKDLNQSFAWP